MRTSAGWDHARYEPPQGGITPVPTKLRKACDKPCPGPLRAHFHARAQSSHIHFANTQYRDETQGRSPEVREKFSACGKHKASGAPPSRRQKVLFGRKGYFVAFARCPIAPAREGAPRLRPAFSHMRDCVELPKGSRFQNARVRLLLFLEARMPRPSGRGPGGNGRHERETGPHAPFA